MTVDLRYTHLPCVKSWALVKGEDEAPEVQESAEGMTWAIASTSSVDRYGDIILQEGWQLDNFRSYGPIMMAHDYSIFPIGRAASIGLQEVEGHGLSLVMQVEWDQEDPLGQMAARKYANGFAKGFSVGFRPLQYRWRSELAQDHPHYGTSGLLVERAELLEVSAAPIPVLQDALVLNGWKEASQAVRKSLQTGAAPSVDHILQALDDTRVRMKMAGLMAGLMGSRSTPSPSQPSHKPQDSWDQWWNQKR